MSGKKVAAIAGIAALLLLAPGVGPEGVTCAGESSRLAVRVLPVTVSARDAADFFAESLVEEFSKTEGYSLFPWIGVKAVMDRLSATEEFDVHSGTNAGNVRLGQALNADRLLAVHVVKEGGGCGVTLSLYGISTASLEKKERISGGCSDTEMLDAMKHFGHSMLREKADRNGGPATETAVPESSDAKSDDRSLTFVRILGGEFLMGSDGGDGDEGPAHTVRIDDFYMSIHEVTQAQWQAVMGSNPSRFPECATCPVENVTWNEVQPFLRKAGNIIGARVRLPTEAQWEYAAGGGADKQIYAGTSSEMDVKKYAWYSVNADGRPHPAGMKMPNRFGVYDLMGNVREWCADRYDESYYAHSPAANPTGPTAGETRVVRGGQFLDERIGLMVTARDSFKPGKGGKDLGFRVVLDTSTTTPVGEYITATLAE